MLRPAHVNDALTNSKELLGGSGVASSDHAVPSRLNTMATHANPSYKIETTTKDQRELKIKSYKGSKGSKK